MGQTLVEAPAEYPVTVDQAKEFLRFDSGDLDDTIELVVQGETAYAESFMGRALVPQTWDYTLDAFPTETSPSPYIELPMPRVISISGVFYKDSDDAEQPFTDFTADLTSEPARIKLAPSGTWPTTYEAPGAVRIRFVAGYSDGSSPPAADVLPDIKIAILMRVKATIDGGEMADGLRNAADVYLRRHRVHLALA